jgi:hypothetical protein
MIRKIVGQGLFYLCAALTLGFLSASPTYTHMGEDKAMIKVSFSHGADRKIPCVKRTREELMALPPNMRRPMRCTRERMPVYVEVKVDGDMVIAESLPPMGLAKDGRSRIYSTFIVSPGEHRVEIGIRDSRREEGFDYELTKIVRLSPRQNLVVDFHGDRGIVLKNETVAP